MGKRIGYQAQWREEAWDAKLVNRERICRWLQAHPDTRLWGVDLAKALGMTLDVFWGAAERCDYISVLGPGPAGYSLTPLGVKWLEWLDGPAGTANPVLGGHKRGRPKRKQPGKVYVPPGGPRPGVVPTPERAAENADPGPAGDGGENRGHAAAAPGGIPFTPPPG